MAPPAFLHPFARPASEEFITIVGGEGARVFDKDGKSYVDALASLWYCNVGHGRREIADAVTAQMAQLACFHTFERFTNEPADQLAELLVSMAPMSDARVFFTDSGSEAVDSAIKLVRMAHVRAGHPERTIIVGRQQAYHGVTYGGVSMQGLPLNKEGFGPLLGDTRHVAHNDLDELREVLEREGDRVAAVMAEPVIGAGGVIPPELGYLEGLRKLCDEYGAFLVLDEVICGFGRLGTAWGAERYGVVPDAVTFAKAVTSGYQPLGGVLVGQAIRQPLEADEDFILRHGHTYSGHPTACAAALANIGILRDENLYSRANAIADRLGAGLQELAAEGTLRAARGEGGIWAAVLPEDVALAGVRDRLIANGVIARPLGTDTIAFCPPLVITDEDMDRCVDTLARSIAAR